MTANRIIIPLLALFLVACAGKTAPQLEPQYYPKCREPLEEVKNLGGGKAMASGAGKGALTGATAGLIGGAIAGLITGRPINVLTGVAVGAGTGAVTGAIYGGGSQRDENRLMAKYLEQIDGDISDLTLDGAAAAVSLQCYDRAFKTLLANIRAGEISQKAASARFGEIEAGSREAEAMLGRGENQSQAWAREYSAATAKAKLPRE